MNAKSPLNVLFLEDDPNDAEIVCHCLRGLAVVERCDQRESFENALKRDWDCLLLDLRLNDIHGTEAMVMARQSCPDLPIIIVTGSVNHEEAALACQGGAVDYIIKGDGYARLKMAITSAYEQRLHRLQAMRDQRLEILGQLSAGIVHDINGVLAVMMMGTEQLRQRINPMDERILDAMLSASKRGAEMTEQILTFAKGTNGSQFKQVSVEYLLGQIGQLVRTTFPANIYLSMETALGTSAILGDATQLVQVLSNLCLNARDAMPKGGELHIYAQNMGHGFEALTGPCVCISVRDTGSGIPDEALQHIFDPFFTTKEQGRGTGLGLSTVKRILEAHHGSIDVKTGSAGTIFFIYLPIAVPWVSVVDDTDQTVNAESKCILVVDDQASFRELTAMVLESAAYKVITAVNGPEALSLFRAPYKIDALIVDLMMPVMTGEELARNLRSVGLTLPIIYISGYDATQPHDPPGDAILQKPISRQTLLATLQKVMAAPT